MAHTYEYPRPNLTVDCVVFGLDVEEKDLKVMLFFHFQCWVSLVFVNF